MTTKKERDLAKRGAVMVLAKKGWSQAAIRKELGKGYGKCFVNTWWWKANGGVSRVTDAKRVLSEKRGRQWRTA